MNVKNTCTIHTFLLTCFYKLCIYIHKILKKKRKEEEKERKREGGRHNLAICRAEQKENIDSNAQIEFQTRLNLNYMK
jgi:hypothetical protein